MKNKKVLNFAAYVRERYANENNNETIDEMKIHKLLYFAQRESFIRFNKPLFNSDFHAWKYGPVLHDVRTAYKDETIFTIKPSSLTPNQLIVMDYVFNQYSQKNSWSLSRLTHGEYSWKHAREGYSDDENSDEIMLLEDIKKDAKRQLERRKQLAKAGIA